MSRKGRITAAKRQRERAVVDRRREKQARRVETKPDTVSVPSMSGDGVDPDIDGIIPGPQPLQAWQLED